MIRIRRTHSISASMIAAILVGLLTTGTARATLLYSNTNLFYTDAQQTQPAGALVGTSVGNPIIMMDDVLIQNALLHPTLPLQVTKVTLGVLRAPNAPAVDVTGYWTSLITPVPDNSDVNGFPLLNTPLNSLGSVSLPASTSSVTSLETVVFGNGVDTLFTVSPAFDDPFAEGYGEFAVGMSMSAATYSNLWAVIDPDNQESPNGDFVWTASSVNSVGDAAFLNIPDPQNPNNQIPVYAVLYMQIEGVPEPTSAALVGGGMLVGLLRRRRNY